MTEIFLHEFIKKFIFITYIFEVQIIYQSYLDDDNETDFWNDENDSFNNLINMF